MNNDISLNSAMRSNLLSLQHIAGQQDIVQNRLASGLKVSAAIDNPSSYYTAQSLNNRAADLTALLDSMAQGIQTIKAANQAIESGTKMLEQAKAIIDTAASTANKVKIDTYGIIEQQRSERAGNIFAEAPDRAWLLANGADFVVENENELRDALAVAASGQKIVINGEINLTINRHDQQLQIGAGIELLGAGALHDGAVNADGSYKAKLNIVNNSAVSAVYALGNNTLSNIELNIESVQKTHSVYMGGGNNNIKDVDLFVKGGQKALVFRGTTLGKNFMNGNINLISNNTNDYGGGIYVWNSEVDIEANLNIYTAAKWGHGVQTASGVANILEKSVVNIHTTNDTGYVFDNDAKSILTIEAAKINAVSDKAGIFFNEGYNIGGNSIIIKSGTEIAAEGVYLFRNAKSATINPVTGAQNNYFSVEAGVKIFFDDKANNNRSSWETNALWEKFSTTLYEAYDYKTFEADGWLYKENNYFPENNPYLNQYLGVLQQYDELIADSSYKGINLLLEQQLKINFNEDRSSALEIKGVDASKDGLGLKTDKWDSAAAFEQTVNEINQAVSKLRRMAADFGNYYSIVSNREEFTENLINVLTEGADKLTLADMNQESANMLALQTSQQLAVNSLSLASQAAQSVLKLF